MIMDRIESFKYYYFEEYFFISEKSVSKIVQEILSHTSILSNQPIHNKSSTNTNNNINNNNNLNNSFHSNLTTYIEMLIEYLRYNIDWNKVRNFLIQNKILNENEIHRIFT
jgi:hypothetical protein